MKQITYDEAIELIAKYSKGLSDDKEIDPKKDQFTIVLPLEHHQMIIVRLVNEDGKRTLKIDVTDCGFIMPKQKDTILNIFEGWKAKFDDSRWHNA